MNNLIVLRYSKGCKLDELRKNMSALHETFPDYVVIVLPQDLDIMFNWSLTDLIKVRDDINSIIDKKEESEYKDKIESYKKTIVSLKKKNRKLIKKLKTKESKVVDSMFESYLKNHEKPY